MRRALKVIVAIAIFTGCVQPPAMPDMPPFNELDGVTLGMLARDLPKTRPNALVSGYVGYHEITDQGRIEYHFPGSYSEDQAPPARSKLRGVAFVEEAASDSAAEALWRVRVRQASATLGRNPLCHEYDTSFVHGLVAAVGDVTVTLRYRLQKPRPVPPDVTTQLAGLTPARSRTGRIAAC